MKPRLVICLLVLFCTVFLPASAETVHLRDVEELYAEDDPLSVIDFYLTVFRGEPGSRTDHSWEELNNTGDDYYEAEGIERYQVLAELRIGSEDAPAYPATVNIRGRSSARYAQKSYKIKLTEKDDKWRGQDTFQLNKHMPDRLRFRNKLANDLLQEVPQLIGLRTQFVRLYVRDLTESNSAGYIDHGIYTQVEALNKTGLKSHGLDPKAQLYKASSWEFYRYPEAIRLETDPEYDVDAFEERLEIKGSSDHRKLIEMLDDLNNYEIPISEILEKHFDRENLCYWLAFELLIGNSDTTSRNFYLYSPSDSSTWYIIPWDHDAILMHSQYALENYSEYGSWQVGISNYWGSILFRRALMDEGFRLQLDEVLQELRVTVFNTENLMEKAEAYAEVLQPFISREPDLKYSQYDAAEYEYLLNSLPDEVELNVRNYERSLESPMPFFISKPEISDWEMHFYWEKAFDFDGEPMRYTLILARDPELKDAVFSGHDITDTHFVIPCPGAGVYYIYVRAENESGYSQEAFDYVTDDHGKYYGMTRVDVP